jgi:TetR/AcrR family transcriptional regulator, lmrAB and yxaGH operons repressor
VRPLIMARLVAERADTIAPLAEVFREHGYEGAGLALIGKATGLGKGSLYHFFPNGKEEMVRAVLGEIGQWFEDAV